MNHIVLNLILLCVGFACGISSLVFDGVVANYLLGSAVILSAAAVAQFVWMTSKVEDGIKI